jgi:long-chain acyl-CoA synthetase
MHFTYPLHRAIQQYPDRLAVVCGERRTSYRQLHDRVARLASALRELGMASGDRVAMLALNSDRYLEYQFAVPWGAGVLNPCNIRWSPAEIAYSLDDSGTEILLVDQTFLPMVDAIRAQAGSLRQVIYCGDGTAGEGMADYEALIAAAEPIEDARRGGTDLCAILYTGGTTGFPKGVMLSHDAFACGALSIIGQGIAPAGTYLHAAPMFHVADFMFSCAHWWQGNGHVVLPVFDPAAFVAAVEQEQVTTTLLVPTMIQMLLDHPAFKAAKGLGSLGNVIYGASPMPAALLDRAIAALPQAAFTQAYGMTECAPATFSRAARHGGDAPERATGRAAPGLEISIRDEAGTELPTGQVGEVWLRGPNMMQGYWGKLEQTEAALHDGWLRTGDGAVMDETGQITVVDRIKDMIITGGENVYSAEVENAIALHPAVAASAVIGLPHQKWGETVHAVVVLREPDAASEQAIIDHCRALIAAYKCPRSVSFAAALPLSAAGKVLKHELRQQVGGNP